MDTRIRRFADNNPSLTIHANTTRSHELPCSNGFDVITILMEHLNAFVAVISHQDVVIGINKDLARI